jgi:diguanylate cyclase (GGDEF)-like protein
VSVFLVVFSLAGVLAALVRLGYWSAERRSALRPLTAGLILAILASIALELVSYSSLRTLSSMMFMAAYMCIGLFGLNPAAYKLSPVGRGSPDKLTGRRLLFLGTAVAIIPVGLGLSEILGRRTNATLLVLGGGLVTALVMVRIRRLYLDRERAEQALRHLASHDPLTNLVNRRELEGRLQYELAQNRPGALLFCDLDDFKKVNDRLGHAAGDHLIVEVAGRLSAAVRRSDTVARLGGDEFLVLLADAQPRDVEGVLSRISVELSRPVWIDGSAVTIGASVGVAGLAPSREAEQVISRADHAMYRAKRQPEPEHGAIRVISSFDS